MDDYQRIEKVIHYLEAHQHEQPDLKTLAKLVGLSEFHFQRLFKRWAGITPKSFLQFLTAAKAKEILKDSDVLTTSHAVGLSGPGRLHDLIVSLEAVTPGELKSGGEGIEIVYGIHDSPFGQCLIGVTTRGVCHLSFVDRSEKIAIDEMKAEWPKAKFKASQSETTKAVSKVFGEGGKLSVLVQGTSFQTKVWEALLRIPEGALVSYEDLAEVVGNPKAARAVGSAVGKNSIGFLIPCHRVIRQTGVIGHYRWGSERKKAMLNWEFLRKVSDK